MQSARWQRSLVGIAGVLASGVFVYFAARRLDLHAVRSTWETARLLPWLPLAVLAYLTGHLARGWRLRVLIRREATLPWLTATNIIVIGYASNNVFPARLGELVRAGVLVERTGMPFGEALTITFIERLLDGIAILMLLLCSSAFGVTAGWIGDVVRAATLIFGGALTAVLVGVFFPNLLLSAAARLAAPLGVRWRDRVLTITTHVINGGACLRRPDTAMAVALLSLMTWTLEAGMFALILPAFGLPLRLGTGALAMSVTNLGILVPSTPGYIGPFHFFCSQALVSQGVAGATALSYAVLVHLAFYIPITVWGAAAIVRYGIEIGATVASARAARRSPAAKIVGGARVHVIAHLEPPRRTAYAAGELNAALTEAMLPPCDPHVAREVAEFVAGQMEALPPRLQMLFHLGMTFFRACVRLRYLSGFCTLPLDKRRRIVEAWAFGRVATVRQLFRPVRSLALLAYYERGDVARALALPSQPRVQLAAREA